jgi:hypothetical protein
VASELRSTRSPADKTLGRIVDDLEKYAGWLERGRRAAGVRGDVQTLRTSIAGGDYFELQDSLQALVFRLRRVPDGSVRRLLHKSLTVFRAVAAQEYYQRAARGKQAD